MATKETSDKKTKKEAGKRETKTLVLLDSHAIIHRAYHALPDFASSKGVPTGAIYGLVAMLIGIIERFKPDYIVACYDLPAPTYRHEAYEAYKAGRKKSDPALVEQLKSSRRVFEAFNIPMYDKEGFEADDMLGTIVEDVLKGNVKADDADLKVIIASGDMDTLQLVSGDDVMVYTLKKGIKDIVVYDEKGVMERFGFGPKLLPDYKGLRGDPSDNIIGIQGIGEKTATTLITSFGTVENIYKALKKNSDDVKKVGVTDRIIELLKNGEEEALFSKMLATIRRDAPINFKLPEKTWKESFDVAPVEALFKEFEFRTLGVRLKTIMAASGSLSDADGKAVSVEDIAFESKKEAEQKAAEYTEFAAHLSKEKIRELTIALWVLDSSLTNPTIEDVVTHTKAKTAAEAEQKLLNEMKKQGVDSVFFDIEKPLIPIVNAMEKVGVKIDVEFLKELSKEYHKELASLEKKIWKEAGMEFNVSSPKQLGEVLFDKLMLGGKKIKKTSTGARSTKESELEKMKGTHPIIDHILEYRELAKLLGTYIDPLPTMVDENDRVHTTFLQAGAATGRMASQNPGLQNIPIKTELGRKVRQAFIAEKGYKLVSFDYSQIELRIAAWLSDDEKLITIFKEGTDVHTGVASQVFKVDSKDVTKEMRRQAKVINFGILYGMGVNALKTNLGSTREEAQTFYNEYFKNFSTLADYLNHVKAEAKRTGYTQTYFGRRRYFEGFKSALPFIRASAERMAINAPIQGTEADLVKIAMVKVQELFDKEGIEEKDARVLMQVHDELVYEIKSDLVESLSEKIKEAMESILTLEDTKGVPITAEAHVGKNWNDMK
ncbi:MAG: hypothetical protein RL094_60 [Candidatus Parcubacteria bacterium]|jgi:DNA polymerase-1